MSKSWGPVIWDLIKMIHGLQLAPIGKALLKFKFNDEEEYYDDF